MAYVTDPNIVHQFRLEFSERMKDRSLTQKEVIGDLAKKHGLGFNTVEKYVRDLKPKWRRGMDKTVRKARSKKMWETRKRKEAEQMIKAVDKERAKLAEAGQKLESVKNKELVSAHNMRNRVVEVCEELGHDPIRELVVAAGKTRDARERNQINKYLTDKLVPNVKSIDIQQDVNMNVSVMVRKFGSDTGVLDVDKLKQVAHASMPGKERYAEFYENPDEDE